jgi:hypothetical protein
MLTMDRGALIREGTLAALSTMPFIFRGLLAVHVGA